MKQFLFKILFLSMPVLIVLIGVNYTGDAAKLFHKDYEAKMASIMMDGKNVTNVSNYSDRRLVDEILSRTKEKNDILVLGSSRTFLINKKRYPGRNIKKQ